MNVHVSGRAEGAETREQITREDGGGRLLRGRRGLGWRPRAGRLRGEVRGVRLSGAGMQGDGHAERKFVEQAFMDRRALARVERTDANEDEVFGKIPRGVVGAAWIPVKCDAVLEQGTK